MQARQGTHVPHNVYLEDDAWDFDLLLVQAHTADSATLITEAINEYIDRSFSRQPMIFCAKLPRVPKRQEKERN